MYSCIDKSKEKELQLKEKELEIREKELQLNNNKLAISKDSLSSIPNKNKDNKNSWEVFYSEFKKAVQNKNIVKISTLSVSDEDFFDGGGGNNSKEFLELLIKTGHYNDIIDSLNEDQKETNKSEIICGDYLVFIFKDDRWYWQGIIGD